MWVLDWLVTGPINLKGNDDSLAASSISFSSHLTASISFLCNYAGGSWRIDKEKHALER
jgi:hypothetical protein